jgi:uncharacterized protein (DUF1330 family)
MPAYVISEVEILDETRADAYRGFASASIEQYGGRYIVRGGAVELLEGERNHPKRRFVIVEFPSMQRAHEWYRSPDYAEALKVRDGALIRTLTFVEGVG